MTHCEILSVTLRGSTRHAGPKGTRRAHQEIEMRKLQKGRESNRNRMRERQREEGRLNKQSDRERGLGLIGGVCKALLSPPLDWLGRGAE